MKRSFVFSIPIMFFLAIAACSMGKGPAADCDPHADSCTKSAGEYVVTLDIMPKPVVHMKELAFDVSFEGKSPEADILVLDLSMPGMDMGKNRVELEKSMDSHYRGTGIIVRCASGKTLWKATLLLSDTLKPAFTFNVRE